MQDALNAIINSTFLGAILLTITLILIGYLFTRHKIFKNNPTETLSTIVMKVALPCLAFSGFMSDFNAQQLGVLLFSFIAYIIILLIGRIIFIKSNKENRGIYQVIFAIGQVSLFGLPIAKAMYGGNAVTSSNMILFSFRIFLYVYAFFVISNEQANKENLKSSIKKVFVNPIMIAMFVGILIWISQLFMPRVTIGENEYSVLRIDKTLPQLFYVIDIIGDLSIPLGMLLVGTTLGEIEVKDAFTNKIAYLLSFLRSFIAPLIVIGLCVLYQLITKGTSLEFDHDTLCTIVICFAAPFSVAANTYSIKYKRNPILTSDCVLLSTIMSIITLPILVILVELIF